MKNISIKHMLDLSNRLYDKHRGSWKTRTPESNIYWIAWLVGEIGEVIDIVKSDGSEKIMKDKKVRENMLEEIVDCYMYLADILNRYKYNSREFSEAYISKMNYNFKRDYNKVGP